MRKEPQACNGSIDTWLVTPEQIKTLRQPRSLSWLTPGECQQFCLFGSQKRKADWLAGRLAAKQLLQEYLSKTQKISPELNQIEIYNENSGAVSLRVASTIVDLSDLNISIAHSQGHGVCALAHTRQQGWVGVDLQEIRPIAPNMQKRFLNEKELVHFRDLSVNDSIENLILYWALKEAAFKSLRNTHFLKDFNVALKEPNKAHIDLVGRKLQIEAHYWKWESFWLAVALRPSIKD